MTVSMLPREHGAYGQLAFPLATALVVAGVTPPGLLIALAAVAGFLAHEPLLITLGRRGPRARRDHAARAARWLVVTSTLAVAAGGIAVWLAPPATRWSFMVPLVPATVLAGAVVLDREKSGAGEIAAAMAFSGVAIPVCLVAGAAVSTALSVGIAFGSLFAGSTLGVRIVILKVRGGGDPQQVRAARRLLLILTGGVFVGVVTAATNAVLPWTTLLAIGPGLLVALALAFRPPDPTRLRTVGWTLVGTSTAAALILMAALPRMP
jgi:hypothetical protein